MAAVLGQGDAAIDATVGNGHDTLFLAQCVGPKGHVFGFNIQEKGLARARSLLDQHDLTNRVQFLCANHAKMADYLPKELKDEIQVIMFNLGYLPGGDKSLITNPADTIDALNAARELLKPAGILTIVSYRGHPGGREECAAVEKWSSSLDSKKSFVERVETSQGKQSKTAPLLFIIKKRE